MTDSPVEQKTWKIYSRNRQLEMDGFYISFNDKLSNSPLGHIWDSDDGGAETALVKNHKYYILNGDFRKEYEQLVDEGFDACYQFFKDNSEHKSSWSD